MLRDSVFCFFIRLKTAFEDYHYLKILNTNTTITFWSVHIFLHCFLALLVLPAFMYSGLYTAWAGH